MDYEELKMPSTYTDPYMDDKINYDLFSDYPMTFHESNHDLHSDYPMTIFQENSVYHRREYFTDFDML